MFTLWVYFQLYTEQPSAPTVTEPVVKQTRISFAWKVSTTCFESVIFETHITWSDVSGEGQTINVSGNSYVITGLTPGVTYNITLVAVGDGVRSDSVSFYVRTSSGKQCNN